MIERSKDYRRIKRLRGDLIVSGDFYYLIENDGEKDLGVWTFHPHQNGLMGHVNFLEGFRGRIATQSAKDAFQWIYDHTAFTIIYAVIPNEKKRVQMFACAIGFKFHSSDENNRGYILGRPIDMKVAV